MASNTLNKPLTTVNGMILQVVTAIDRWRRPTRPTNSWVASSPDRTLPSSVHKPPMLFCFSKTTGFNPSCDTLIWNIYSSLTPKNTSCCVLPKITKGTLHLFWVDCGTTQSKIKRIHHTRVKNHSLSQGRSKLFEPNKHIQSPEKRYLFSKCLGKLTELSGKSTSRVVFRIDE